ncbi:MAG: pyruvate formate lyase activating enzyme [bacterium]|nr:MAG: pyruvate formate lyase activating enzyme [bacterium]KAF0149659.1 MAG: pyruvate formate lyase activating enzyme [bacterium]KAF0169325.1 MAG: pyruvate formate lyase activating enzyme [bacterium]TXT21401.1 MAG: pyruvate formate lyase activating enzyme [bacterium]
MTIPTLNDSDKELRQLSERILREWGSDVPLQFTTFHPDWKLTNLPLTASYPAPGASHARSACVTSTPATCTTGTVERPTPSCAKLLIVYDWSEIPDYPVTDDGLCPHCDAALVGRFG